MEISPENVTPGSSGIFSALLWSVLNIRLSILISLVLAAAAWHAIRWGLDFYERYQIIEKIPGPASFNVFFGNIPLAVLRYIGCRPEEIKDLQISKCVA